MLPTTIRSPPSQADFVPLEEYQSQTPESFVDSKPVLHYQLSKATASIPKSQRGALALFPADSAGNGTASAEDNSEEVVKQEVDIYVNSENFTIFSTQAEAGVTIPYPSISIHAVKQVDGPQEGSRIQALWMQLEFADGGADDDDFSTVELTIVPADPDATPSQASQLYDAIANCSNLHPDPNNEEDDDEDEYDRIVFEGSAEHEALDGFTGVLRGDAQGGLPPPMPGSGGWITAENVHEYFDEDGNWIGGAQEEEAEELGEGAGRTRGRDELEADAVNGHAENEDSESKRPRVD